MFHVELREGSRRLSRLNLEERELMGVVLEPWVRGAPVELGERTWSPQHTQITVIEGPEVPIGAMTMGRGWPTALREGREVTQAAIERARQCLSAVGTHPHGPSSADSPSALRPQGPWLAAHVPQRSPESGREEPQQLDLLAEALGLELLRRLADETISLRIAWTAAHQRHPEIGAGAALELASAAISNLSRSGLIDVVQGGPDREPLEQDQLAHVLSDPAIWVASEEEEGCLWITRL